MNQFDGYEHNFIMVPTDMKDPYELVGEYAQDAMDCKTLDEYIELFEEFFEEMNLLIGRAYHIEKALQSLEVLGMIDQELNGNYEEDDEDYD